MKKTTLAIILGCTLLAGIALGAGGVYVAGLSRVAEPPAAAVPAAPLVPPPVPKDTPTTPPPVQPIAGDAERALQGVRRGEYLPLETISGAVRTRFPGDILGVKLSEDDGITYYEFKVLTKNGRIIEVEVDPKTGKIIDVDEDDD